MLFDIHTHALPHIDDGAKNSEETAQILKKQRAMGVHAMVLTPHFYPSEESNIDAFYARAEDKFLKLKEQLGDKKPELFLGSEVFMFRGMGNIEDLKKLTLGGSRFILLELPYDRIQPWCVDAIVSINLNFGLTPVLAHLERFRKVDGFHEILSLISEGYALGQANAAPLLSFRGRRPVLDLIKRGYISFIGSDVHSGDSPHNIKSALEVVSKKLGPSYSKKIESNFKELYLEIKGN